MKDTIRGLLSRPSTQPALLQLLKLCHAGLNYGGGQVVSESGEIGAMKFLQATLGGSKPLTIFDIGANDGSYLEAALKVFGNRGKVYSFEPQSAIFERLRSSFGSDPRVELRKTAISNQMGTAELYCSSEIETVASLHSNIIWKQAASETVPLTTVDQFCSDEGIERIDLLKIDTEGHEMEVLLGAASMMQADRIASLQFEFGETFLGMPHHFSDIWELLSPRYSIYRILRHGMIEVRHYSPDLEIYKIANFLCLQKGLEGRRA